MINCFCSHKKDFQVNLFFVRRQSSRCACAEEGKWIYCTKDVDNGAARQEERRRRPQARIMEVVKEG